MGPDSAAVAVQCLPSQLQPAPASPRLRLKWGRPRLVECAPRPRRYPLQRDRPRCALAPNPGRPGSLRGSFPFRIETSVKTVSLLN